MRDVAVLSFAQTRSTRAERTLDDVEMLAPVVARALDRAGLRRSEVGFFCSGSSDYLAGLPFSFVGALNAIGAWPPVMESHVEMDGAWALYEAWCRLQHGDLDTAVVYAFGKSSPGPLRDVLTRQLDPYYLAPLWPDSVSLAALQARAFLEATGTRERQLAEVAVRSRRQALANENAQVRGEFDVDALLAEPYLVSPLRRHDCPPISDAAAAVVLAAGPAVKRAQVRPAWIRGIDHRIEPHALGARDLTRSASTTLAAQKVGVVDAPVDVAELHAPFTHQELILRRALGLAPSVVVNPSGGALAANPVMVAGLIRIGEAATRIIDGSAKRVLAHATSGPCLQQNLVCMMEASHG